MLSFSERWRDANAFATMGNLPDRKRGEPNPPSYASRLSKIHNGEGEINCLFQH